MIIIDPVTLGDAAFSRASSKWVYDRTGALVQVPTGVPAVTYEPADLGKAPYVLIEPAATNVLRRSNQFSFADVWAAGVYGVLSEGTVAWVDGSMTASAYTHAIATGNFAYLSQPAPDAADASLDWVYSLWVKVPSGTATLNLAISDVNLTTKGGAVETVDTTWRRLSFALAAGQLSNTGLIGVGMFGTPGQVYHIFGAQLERGSKPSSYIPTFAAAVTRAADVVGSTAGLLYSNVAETEPLWVTGTYALGARVRDALHTVYESLATANTAPLTDEAKWGKVGATARWAMLDQYNNTQTTAAEEILLTLSPRAIAQGLYLGNLDATEVRLSVVDPVEGLVYSETKDLTSPTQGSSFYNWAFRRIKRSNYFFTTKMPPYAGALVTLAIRKPGGVAKCGMCAIGPVDEFGPSLMGLSTEGKDYSSTTFDADGISSTKIRPYAKRMSVDVSINNDEIDYVHTRLEELRQRPIVWIGGPYGSTAVFGRYGSFRNVVEYFARSKMALQIEGTV